MSRFVMGRIALFLGDGVFSGLGVSVESPFVIAIGGAICAVGFLGCLWSLWQMKIGARSTKGRAVLIAIAVIPMCAGVMALAFDNCPRARGGLLFGCSLLLVLVTILLWLAMFLGRPLSPSISRRQLLGKLSFVVGACALVGGGFLAKRVDRRWPFVGNKSFVVIQYKSWRSPSVSKLEELSLKAAGDYSDDYAIKVFPNAVKVTACCRDSEEPDEDSVAPGRQIWDGISSGQHLRAFYERFHTLLPADTLPYFAFNPVTPIFGRKEASQLRKLPMFLIVAGSFLIVLAGGLDF
ncbi:MAG: hypothetical protein ACJAVK_001062 [Akkermansiaceae bacterium]|jgi:hypothetical protein